MRFVKVPTNVRIGTHPSIIIGCAGDHGVFGNGRPTRACARCRRAGTASHLRELRSQSDAQAAFTADPSDPFGLDVDNNGVACQTEERFGTSSLVTCDDLRDYPDAQPALQGLYDYTQAAGDPYTLDADGNGIACDAGDGKGNRRDDRRVHDGPPAS